jgi:hypothetical protein
MSRATSRRFFKGSGTSPEMIRCGFVLFCGFDVWVEACVGWLVGWLVGGVVLEGLRDLCCLVRCGGVCAGGRGLVPHQPTNHYTYTRTYLGQALGDGGLAHAGLAEEDGVVLGAPGEDLWMC